eukprot:TRINITY_DN1252_c0_g1_i5.p1 TRINITY_DN1252_c0_g1~~TRINITY_DN1252_c0_g1_i5.p1  ORF type:complete len:488 (+),score=99.70 TRINITY_DN1252_c0_g1_i5:591-2054(+)
MDIMDSSARSTPPANIGFDQLSKYFHLPINEVARELGICATMLKKICRRNGIPRWPHRKIKSLNKMIENAEASILTGNPDAEVCTRQEIEILKSKKALIMKNPSILVANGSHKRTVPSTPTPTLEDRERSEPARKSKKSKKAEEDNYNPRTPSPPPSTSSTRQHSGVTQISQLLTPSNPFITPLTSYLMSKMNNERDSDDIEDEDDYNEANTRALVTATTTTTSTPSQQQQQEKQEHDEERNTSTVSSNHTGAIPKLERVIHTQSNTNQQHNNNSNNWTQPSPIYPAMGYHIPVNSSTSSSPDRRRSGGFSFVPPPSSTFSPISTPPPISNSHPNHVHPHPIAVNPSMEGYYQLPKIHFEGNQTLTSMTSGSRSNMPGNPNLHSQSYVNSSVGGFNRVPFPYPGTPFQHVSPSNTPMGSSSLSPLPFPTPPQVTQRAFFPASGLQPNNAEILLPNARTPLPPSSSETPANYPVFRWVMEQGNKPKKN